MLSEKSNSSINFRFINAASINFPLVIDSLYLHLFSLLKIKKLKIITLRHLQKALLL